jgi:hypothetical protein
VNKRTSSNNQINQSIKSNQIKSNQTGLCLASLKTTSPVLRSKRALQGERDSADEYASIEAL